jgi:nicotinamidase-related amidase
MGDVASALSSRQVWLHRPCLSCASENIACRTFDVFHSNPNAGQLVVGSGIKQWLVVGSSLEYCLKSTAMGLRALGCDVLVLEDLVRPARKSTPEGFAATLDELMACDVRLGTLDSFLASMAGESMSR